MELNFSCALDLSKIPASELHTSLKLTPGGRVAIQNALQYGQFDYKIQPLYFRNWKYVWTGHEHIISCYTSCNRMMLRPPDLTKLIFCVSLSVCGNKVCIIFQHCPVDEAYNNTFLFWRRFTLKGVNKFGISTCSVTLYVCLICRHCRTMFRPVTFLITLFPLQDFMQRVGLSTIGTSGVKKYSPIYSDKISHIETLLTSMKHNHIRIISVLLLWIKTSSAILVSKATHIQPTVLLWSNWLTSYCPKF